MNMVGHQTPTQHADAGLGQILLQEAEISWAVGVTGKSLATIDTSLRDMAGSSRQHAALPSWHNAFEYGAIT